jgi:hypothetical protein
MYCTLPCIALYCSGEMCSKPLGATSHHIDGFLLRVLWFLLSLSLSSSLSLSLSARDLPGRC